MTSKRRLYLRKQKERLVHPRPVSTQAENNRRAIAARRRAMEAIRV